MSLLKYFKSKNGLPDPRGELSSVILPWQIALANKEVQAELTAAEKSGKKRGHYKRYVI